MMYYHHFHRHYFLHPHISATRQNDSFVWLYQYTHTEAPQVLKKMTNSWMKLPSNPLTFYRCAFEGPMSSCFERWEGISSHNDFFLIFTMIDCSWYSHTYVVMINPFLPLFIVRCPSAASWGGRVHNIHASLEKILTWRILSLLLQCLHVFLHCHVASKSPSSSQ